MSALTYLQLRTNLEIIQEIKSFKMIQHINEHVTCELVGIINEKYKDDYIKEADSESQIEVFVEGEKKVTLFQGIAKQLEIQFIGGIYYIHIKGVSNSFKLDTKKRYRSFQDKAMTYEALVQEVTRAYAGGDVIDTASKNEKIQKPIVQYNETDWEFLKRLASRFHMGVLPMAYFEGPKVIFGTYEGVERGKIEQYEYTIQKDLGRYAYSSANGYEKLGEVDAMTFYIETTENYDIGDSVMYQRITLFIKSKEVQLVEGILQFKYGLSTKEGFGQDKIFNTAIVGASIRGKVLEVVRDKIKVHLEIDEKQDVGKAWEFPYTTMYTAEGNSGWYCMPEQGDTVYIYFPTHEEGEGVGMNALRIGNKGTDKIEDPQVKYFRTKDGKELKFSPEEIVITCVNGISEETGEPQVIYIRLNQNLGIELISSEPITLKSMKDIELEAEESIKLLAKEAITLKCKQSEIRIDQMVDICGPDVKIN